MPGLIDKRIEELQATNRALRETLSLQTQRLRKARKCCQNQRELLRALRLVLVDAKTALREHEAEFEGLLQHIEMVFPELEIYK
jgi:chromosome segregation ATPase